MFVRPFIGVVLFVCLLVLSFVRFVCFVCFACSVFFVVCLSVCLLVCLFVRFVCLALRLFCFLFDGFVRLLFAGLSVCACLFVRSFVRSFVSVFARPCVPSLFCFPLFCFLLVLF